MKTREDYQRVADEIKAVCEKYGVFIIGTDYSEGIYGEITFGEMGNPNSTEWSEGEKRATYIVRDHPPYTRDFHMNGG